MLDGCRYDVDFVLIAAYTLEVHAKAVHTLSRSLSQPIEDRGPTRLSPAQRLDRPASERASGPPVSPQRIQGDGEQHALYWELSAPK